MLLAVQQLLLGRMRKPVASRGIPPDSGGCRLGGLVERRPGDEEEMERARRVAKIDRLTRSLADFAKIVEILDARSASFVSVTQQFNTTVPAQRSIR